MHLRVGSLQPVESRSDSLQCSQSPTAHHSTCCTDERLSRVDEKKLKKQLFAKQQIALFYFEVIRSLGNDPTDQWQCVCGNKRARGNGCENLFSHVAARHRNDEEQMKSAPPSRSGTLMQFVNEEE